MEGTKKKLWIFFQFIISTIFLVGLDQWTKKLAVEHLKGQAD